LLKAELASTETDLAGSDLETIAEYEALIQAR